MKEHPILFSAPMVQAILDGRKTQTRRIIKPQPDVDEKPQVVPWYAELEEHWNKWVIVTKEGETFFKLSPYGIPGDHLWVREAFVWTWNEKANKWDAFYKADGDYVYDDRGPARWKPSIHMPRFISRITLEVTGIRVERLCDISTEDAKKEGVHSIISFKGLWCKIHGDGAWNLNPWVWVIEFKYIKS